MSAIVTDAFRIEARTQQGGSSSNILRQKGFIPGIMYGSGKESVMVSVDIRDVEKGLHHTNFYTTLYQIDVGGVKERVLVREVQYHPVTDRPIHIDFVRVAKGSKTHVRVPIVFLNEDKSPGIKRGGVLNVVLHALEVSCSVDHIPDHIEIDLAGAEIGHSIHTDQVNLGQGVTPLHPERDVTIATVVAPTVQKAETEEAAPTAEAGAEAETSETAS